MQNAHDTFQVTHNGDECLIVSQNSKVGVTYKDGALEVKEVLFLANLTYVKQIDTIIGPVFLGQHGLGGNVGKILLRKARVQVPMSCQGGPLLVCELSVASWPRFLA